MRVVVGFESSQWMPGVSPRVRRASRQMIAASLSRCSGGGRQTAVRLVDDAHRVLDRDELLAGGLQVAVGPAESRQDQRRLAAHGMGAVELGGDMCGESAGAHGLFGRSLSGVARDEVAGETDEDFGLPVAHGPDGVHRVQAVLGRWSEPELALQSVQERLRHPLPDAHRAVALHVAVPAHRADAGPGAAEIAAQHEEVDDFADRRRPRTSAG